MTKSVTKKFVEAVLKNPELTSHVVALAYEDLEVQQKLRDQISKNPLLLQIFDNIKSNLEKPVTKVEETAQVYVYLGPPDSAFDELSSISSYYKQQGFTTFAANALARSFITPMRMIMKSNEELLSIRYISMNTVILLNELKRQIFVPSSHEHDPLAARYNKWGVQLYTNK